MIDSLAAHAKRAETVRCPYSQLLAPVAVFCLGGVIGALLAGAVMLVLQLLGIVL